MLIWFLRGLPSDNSKLHWLQLKVWIKCLSIKAGGEGSWGKNRNQTQTLKGSEGAGSEARNTASSQILLQSIIRWAAAEYYATAVSETTPYRAPQNCHYVTQSITLCYYYVTQTTNYKLPTTMLHKASRWARLPPISTAVLHMITSNWSPTRNDTWHY